MLTTIFDCEKIRETLCFDAANPLLFNTGLFLILFSIFIVIYQLLQKYKNAKLVFVILFSLYFYYKSSYWYCSILFGVCIFDYILGLLLEKFHTEYLRKSIVAINILMNIGMLVYFKYFNLLLETFASLSDRQFDPLNIVLPAGISFFTFRSISYIVDIYRGTINACRNFLHYTFYLTFFPPLLAGPVVRAKDMLPQVNANTHATKAMISEGFFLIIIGLIKKVVIADYISQNFVDRVFDNPSLYSGFENIIGIYGFALQLYCDFSGYSDMAIGIALILGYRFLDNFRSPFKSQNPTEFWHRWHISLSTWLRDYLYIPLGGNRCSRTRKNLNLMCTMVIGGIWHGASWMYMIWGALQGVFLIFHKELKRILPTNNKLSAIRIPVNILITFNLIAFSFMFFRANSLEIVYDMIHQIFNNFHLSIASQFIKSYYMIVIVMGAGFFMHFAPTSWTDRLKKLYNSSPLILQAVILSIVILIVIQVRSSDIVPFIYLQY